MSLDQWPQTSSGLHVPAETDSMSQQHTIRPHLADVFVGNESNPDYPRPLPIDTTFIVKATTQHASELETKHSHVLKGTIECEDTSRYTALVATPNQKTTEIPVVFTTALGTQAEDQYNLDLMAEYLDLGMPVVLIGPEENTSIPLTLSAQHMHDIFEHYAKFGLYDPTSARITGDSRGAMIGQLFAAYAVRRGIKIIDGCVIDPCLARQIQYTSPREVLEYLPYLTVEGYSFTRQIRRIGFKKGLEHVRRLRMSPGVMLRTGIPLLSGDAGEFSRYMSREQRLHSMLFLASVVNQHKDWIEIYDQFPNVTYELIKGSHLSLMRPDVWDMRKNYMANSRDVYTTAA
ncbi:hypothetical protein KA047_00200 [Candidatus Saccharibacteria bacterium]|nr:hypothetical protein [Candidatus Saccharibacteria bacterium]